MLKAVIKLTGRFLFLVISLISFTPSVSGQSFDFKIFDSSVGLPQNYIYSMAQGEKGYVWIGTSEGLVRYDGFDFITYTTHDSLANDFVQKLLLSENGTLWIGHNNGDLSYQIKEEFYKIELEETISPINDICEDQAGNIWAVEQNSGLIRIDKDFNVTTFFNRKKFGSHNYYSVSSISPSKLLVGTMDGLLLFEFDENFENVKIEEVPEIPYTTIETIVPRKNHANEFWIGTQDEGFYKYSFNQETSEHITDNRLCLLFNIQQETIVDIYEETDGHLLLATWGHGVIKLFYNPATDEYSESLNFSTINGLKVDYLKDIMCDREGNYWFGTYGGGVAALIRDYFIFYNMEELGFKNKKVYSVLKTENELWLGLDKGLMKADPLCFTDFEYYDRALGIPDDKVTGFYNDQQERIWVATENSGLFYRNKGELKFKSYNYTSTISGKKINDIEGVDNDIYIASQEGLYIVDTKTQSSELYNMTKGLPHNSINFVYRDHSGDIWIGPKNSGVCKVDSANIEVHRLIQGAVNIVDMVEDNYGNKWLATDNRGIIKFSEDSLINITVQEGLKKNYCYSLNIDRQNRLWICHHPGLSSYDLNTGQIRTFGYENNMGGEFNQVVSDDRNKLWFASSDGVINYLPENDHKNLVAPLINFTSIKVNGKNVPIDRPIVLSYPYGANYKLEFNFRAISFENPQAVTYQTKLERKGLELESQWNDKGSINVGIFEYLPYGNYQLKIKAFNADGIATSSPLAISISIKKPFWFKIWFLLLLAAVIILLIYLLILFREKKLRQQKQILQKEVASQTIMLRQQKAEIERKNQDITDSINYAKKIQSSILPPLQELTDSLPESFVFFKPRDIVSGDFYWFNRVKDKFILCCADCTGHGVPGAFMSMIGTTILNDIFRIPHINSPADMLEKLDEEIKVMLQKNQGIETRDGMDISVVEVDLKTRRVRLASAKRPVFLYINDELSIYKGNRRSIGDSLADGHSAFVNIEYNCTKGDLIYMFSDGYTDQFGGPLGKKFMKVGVRNLIEEIHDKPVSEQYKIVESNFENWRGELEQVDDVLFMGIKI
ncbi:MAG: SpoIIE family protein phosphatase [Marinilabiliaceae bacterium]|nr:SpoIIE family protein phosphatase [Marinilabiliaceae bacterium]